MRKHIKYSVSSIIIILSFVLGFVANAEISTTINSEVVVCTMDAKVCPDGSSVGRVGPKCEFAKCPGELSDDSQNRNLIREKGEIKTIREENRGKREEVRDEVKSVRGEIQTKREANKAQLEAMIENVKTQREDFRAELELKKEEMKNKAEEMRAKLKEDLKVVKDENKKMSVEKIVDAITALNVRLTTNLSAKTDNIENVLASIESRISKAEANGLDITTVKKEVEKAKQAIIDARSAITIQTGKVYNISITDETTLRVEMQKLRDTFKTDIRGVNELVKKAHIAVRNTAITLAKIPRVNEAIEEDAEVKTEVEVEVESNITNTNQ